MDKFDVADMKANVHAESSAKSFGGVAADYLAIHQFMDSSKAVVADHRHRALTHNTWFIAVVLPRVFGETIKNSEGKEVSVRDIGEQHVLEDFRGKFIPSGQDWLTCMNYAEWMNNGATLPPSSPVAPPAPIPVLPAPLNPPGIGLPNPFDDQQLPTKWPGLPWPNSPQIID
jgi:hypothetical protein